MIRYISLFPYDKYQFIIMEKYILHRYRLIRFRFLESISSKKKINKMKRKRRFDDDDDENVCFKEKKILFEPLLFRFEYSLSPLLDYSNFFADKSK